jgi:hypothetical protein
MADSFTGGGGTRYNTTPRRVAPRPSTPRRPPASGNSGYGDALRRQMILNADPYVRSTTALNAADNSYLAGSSPYRSPSPLPAARRPTPTSSSRGRGGGGGGGGGAASGMSQEMLDWIMGAMGRSAPQATAPLDLPDGGAFDPSIYTNLLASLEQGLATDTGTANTAMNNASQYLTTNYRNPYADYQQAQAPGMQQDAMARMLQGQGVDPSIMAAEAGAMAGANQAFRNVWEAGRLNEDSAQSNRLRNVEIGRADAINNLTATAGAGRAGIGVQRGRAEQEHRLRQEEIARQEALANWEQQNQTSQQTAQYRNQVLQTLLQLLPELQGLALPDLAALGL